MTYFRDSYIFKMKVKLLSIFLSISLIVLFITDLSAQKDQIPIESSLDQHSERQLIKIGMITASKPAKLKFGVFSSDNRKGQSTAKDENNKPLLFSFDLLNSSGEKASIEAATNVEKKEATTEVEIKGDVSIYITTSIDQDDLWVLLMAKTPETKQFSLKNIFLTNGNDEITFKNSIGEPTGKSEVTAPKGIIAYINGNPLGAMQYYSGGSFSYKKFIWISKSMDEQLQLVTAAVFSSMLELGDYFIDTEFVD
jgi:hypothetical protein